MESNILEKLFREYLNSCADLEIINSALKKNESEMNDNSNFIGIDNIEANREISLLNERRKLELQIYPIQQRKRITNLNLATYLKEHSITKGEIELEKKRYKYWVVTEKGIDQVKFDEVQN